jgi:adenylate cyclase
MARCRDYEVALAAFCQRHWDAAESALIRILEQDDDGPSRWLLARVQEMRKQPPPADWQGEYWRLDKY